MGDATANAKAKGTLVGLTAASNGNPVIGALITASAGALSYTTHTVAIEGGDGGSEFRLDLPPGTYLVKADFDGFLTAEQAGVVIKPHLYTDMTLTLSIPKPR